MQKNNPRTHSPQQYKKAVLAAAAYFKTSTPVRSQGQYCSLVTFDYRKGCFWYKTEKVNITIELCILELV